MQVPASGSGPPGAPALVQRACTALEARFVSAVCQFWRVFLQRTLQLAHSPQDARDRSRITSRCFGMSFDHHIFVPTWCDWVRRAPVARSIQHTAKHKHSCMNLCASAGSTQQNIDNGAILEPQPVFHSGERA